MEIPEVFDEAHAEVVRWFREGLVDGLRIDHPDGLADPAGYLRRLREVTGGSYLLIEKILEPGEVLPAGFDCEGTTGYDALADVDRVFVDAAGQAGAGCARRRAARRPGRRLRGHDPRHQAPDHGRDPALGNAPAGPAGAGRRRAQRGRRAADALSEIIAAFPVYRSYLPEGADVLREACELAIRRRPELEPAVGLLLPLLLDAGPGADAELGRRFQQTSGMVMAKGVEDTAFFRYTRLGTLTEVGADPTEFAVTPEEFHARMARRQAELPLSMTTLSTHDTKRSEDTRARISVLAELAPEWTGTLARLQKLAPLPDGPLANLLWQAIAGVWPADRERLQSYAQKAAREAGNSTDWIDPDEAFEAKLSAAVDAAFDNAGRDARSWSPSWPCWRRTGPSTHSAPSSCSSPCPECPDVYQGTEFWDRSLTDPDNRRPFDFGERQRALAALDAGERPASYLDDAAKLLVTSRALRLRRDRPELFTGYTPVTATGDAAAHLLAFDRGTPSAPGALTLATRLPRGLEQRGGWQDTAIQLAAAMTDELTGNTYGPGRVAVGEILRDYPVALLAPAV